MSVRGLIQSNNEDAINENAIESINQIDNVEGIVLDETDMDTAVELYDNSQRDKDSSNLVLIGFVMVSIVLGS